MLCSLIDICAGSYETVSRCQNHIMCPLTTTSQTTSTLMTFALAMVLYPDVQRRAQAEIDSVVGEDRLPTFEDRASLPYVESVLRETLRWHPILPKGILPCRAVSPSLKTLIGVPHATLSDDIFDGYFIPKGLPLSSNEQVIGNIIHQERLSCATYGQKHSLQVSRC
jgi:hypothetical protein